MHAADEQPPGGHLHFERQRLVATFLGLFLLRPAAERVGRRGDGCEPVIGCHIDDDAAQSPEVFLGFLDVFADFGADLDLRAQQLGRYLCSAALLALGHQTLGRVDDQAARFLVDQKIFFFDAYREFGTAFGHGFAPFANRPATRTWPVPGARCAPESTRLFRAATRRFPRHHARHRSGPGEFLSPRAAGRSPLHGDRL